MKVRGSHLLGLVASFVALAELVQAAPLMGTAFTYQGRLEDPPGTPVTAMCDFQFSLWDSLVSPTGQVGVTVPGTPDPVSVTAGLFSLTVDFGELVFYGDKRWLKVEVRCPTGVGGYTALTPRQELTPTPYALALPGLYTQQNATSPNLIGGFNGNTVTGGTLGATIGGGGNAAFPNQVTDTFGTVSGGVRNQAGDNAGTTVDRPNATVGGGSANIASGAYSTVGGGQSNTGSGYSSTIGGGHLNTASIIYSTVGGGVSNTASGESSTIGGGRSNAVSAPYATIAGGGESTPGNPATANRVTDDYGTVGGGGNNQAGNNAGTTLDRFYATVGGGQSNTASGIYSTVSGGFSNIASGFRSSVSGGDINTASSLNSAVGGGYANTASHSYSTVGGGAINTASGAYGAVGGGLSNTASGTLSTVGGGQSNQAQAFCATIGGGGESTLGFPATANRVTDEYGTVGGGGNNQAGDNAGTTTDQTYATVGGGQSNTASGVSSAVGGGQGNTATAFYSTIGGGITNAVIGNSATVGGGSNNIASNNYSSVSGGQGNSASGYASAIVGGQLNQAGGDFSFASGRRAKVRDAATVGGGDPNGDEGTFLWSDSTVADFTSDGPNRFLVRASGGSTIYSDSTLTAGVDLPAGGGSWSSVSDRNLKENVAEVDARDILERLAQVPVTTWNYKSQNASIRHMGPMGQDFHAAFGVGETDTRLSTIDVDGVAIAAIQGLYQIVQDKECRISELDRQNSDVQQQSEELRRKNEELEARLAVLETAMNRLAQQQTGR